MFINLDVIIYMYIRSKYLNESLVKIWKEFKIFRLCNQFFSFTNDFDSSGGRVMKFTASGHRSLYIDMEVNVNIFTEVFGIH